MTNRYDRYEGFTRSDALKTNSFISAVHGQLMAPALTRPLLTVRPALNMDAITGRHLQPQREATVLQFVYSKAVMSLKPAAPKPRFTTTRGDQR